MNKREFLKLFMLAGASHLLPISKAYSNVIQTYNLAEGLKFLPILQGATTDTFASFSILAAKEYSLNFKILKDFVVLPNTHINIVKIVKNFSPWAAYKIAVSPLEPGVEYQLVVEDFMGGELDVRLFSTRPQYRQNLKFVMASCMRDIHRTEQKPMWASVAATESDCIFLLGDNVYVDQNDSTIKEETIWRRYVETRLELDLYKWPRLVPTFATWDDHDYGKNNTHRDFDLKNESRDIFRSMYAQDPHPNHCNWGPGVASSIEINDQRFFLMDNRTFRTAPCEYTQSHWGRQQENWIYDELKKNSNPAWIFNGSQFFGGYRSGWAFEKRHPKNLKAVRAQLKKVNAPIVFGSGDVHYSEVMKLESELLGYETYELTSSSIHSAARKPRPGSKRRIVSTGEYNFLCVNAEKTSAGLVMDVESIGAGSRTLFQLSSLLVVGRQNHSSDWPFAKFN